jgi:hypothetical protein
MAGLDGEARLRISAIRPRMPEGSWRNPHRISNSDVARPPSLSHLEASRVVLDLAAAARGTAFLARRQETGKLRHIQEIAMADGREAMPKRGLINGSFSLFA